MIFSIGSNIIDVAIQAFRIIKNMIVSKKRTLTVGGRISLCMTGLQCNKI